MTNDELLDMGFEFIAYKEPLRSCGVDLYYGYDYFIKKIGVKTDLVLRKKHEKVKVEGFYCSDIKNKRQLFNLIDILTQQT